MLLKNREFLLTPVGNFMRRPSDGHERQLQQNIAMGSKAHDDKAFIPGNLQAIENFRHFYRQFGSGKTADAVLAEHHAIFIPFAQHLLKTIRSENQSLDIQKLGNEVEGYLKGIPFIIQGRKLIDWVFSPGL